MDWASAYEELLPKVYHYFCLRIGDRFEAEDLTAATFERAWRDRERFRTELGTFTNWLFGIARHVAIAHLRQHEQKQSTAEPSTEESYRPTEEAAATQEEFDRLASMLSVLPEREREIFSLKYGAQFTNRSIAKIVRLSESNVGTILHRTVSRLREQLEDGK
ncbi:MAG TPA: RNA polymerase sigma factor [Anaerolineales bacterium]|nr:RNA polymerase sigma factor [Anaerolineales bacterium]